MESRTEELIKYLQDHQFTAKQSSPTEIVYTGGKLMGLPVDVLIHPGFCIAKFRVSVQKGIGGCVFTTNLHYAGAEYPLDIMLNAVCEKLIMAIKQWQYEYGQ